MKAETTRNDWPRQNAGNANSFSAATGEKVAQPDEVSNSTQRRHAAKNFNRRLRLMDADNVGQRVPSVSDLGIISARLCDVSRGELPAVRDRAMIYLARVKSPLAALGKLIK